MHTNYLIVLYDVLLVYEPYCIMIVNLHNVHPHWCPYNHSVPISLVTSPRYLSCRQVHSAVLLQTMLEWRMTDWGRQPSLARLDPWVGETSRTRPDPWVGEPIRARLDPWVGEPVRTRLDPWVGSVELPPIATRLSSDIDDDEIVTIVSSLMDDTSVTSRQLAGARADGPCRRSPQLLPSSGHSGGTFVDHSVTSRVNNDGLYRADGLPFSLPQTRSLYSQCAGLLHNELNLTSGGGHLRCTGEKNFPLRNGCNSAGAGLPPCFIPTQPDTSTGQ